MRFRPCIDLHEGRVKQIVGATLTDRPGPGPRTNFVSARPPAWFAQQYRRDGLDGGHVILLGPGNEAAAAEALAAFPGGLQLGGGVTAENAGAWLSKGAAKVIVTSWVFREGRIHWDRLSELRKRIGRDRLVLDLSCRSRGGAYYVVTDRWQRFTDVALDHAAFRSLAEFCSEFLVHAVDREGLQAGPDPVLVRLLAAARVLPVTYAGGIRSWNDVDLLAKIGRGRLDFTVGSALDIFGGSGLRYRDLVDFNRDRKNAGGQGMHAEN